MATYATASVQRPKKLVRYGKSTSRSTWSTKHVDSWLDDEESDAAAPNAKRVQTVKATYQVQKPAIQDSKKQEAIDPVRRSTQQPVPKHESSKPGSNVSKPLPNPARPAPQSAKQHAKSRDLFDVPSSGDEAEEDYVLKRPTPPNSRHSKTLVDDTDTVEALAPWETRRTSVTDMRTWRGSVSPEAQLKSDLAKEAVRCGDNEHAIFDTPARVRTSETTTSTSLQEPSTAAARLAARRQQHRAPSASPATTRPPVQSNKRSDAAVEATLVRPSKRARKASPPPTESEDTFMTEATPAVVCENSSNEVLDAGKAIEIYDFPVDDETSPPPVTMKPKQAMEKNKRRTASSSARATPIKGLSAPAALAQMLPADTDSTDTPSRSPSVLHSRTATLRRSATPANAQKDPAPAHGHVSSSSPTTKATGTLTPKQAQLWSQLLPSDPPADTPSSLAMKDLRLEGRRRRVDKVPSLSSTLTKSKSDVPELHTCRVRLVDRLKAAASSSDSDSSEEQSDIDDDVVMSNVQSASAKDGIRETQAANTQSQSQSQAAAESGPRITYARTRSYLPEDNPEDALLFGLPAFTPAKPAGLVRQPGRTNAALQKSAFDLEDSDEEAGTGRIRTIHELRAAGRNNRFMQETETLLEDIAQDSSSGRSRRRSALAELATKLMEKGFAERFCAQGFERALADSIAASARDLVGDVLGMAVISLLLLAEPPDHVVTHLKERNLIAAFGYTLSEELDFSKLVKERKHNIAKATQGTFASFAITMLGHEALWAETRPRILSPRILALKTMDLLVGRLRRLGDRSELLDETQLQLVLPESESDHEREAADLGLAVSVLEALSSSALRLQWPEDLLQRLAALLSSLGEATTAPKHTVFLALRLTLNLTNDNARNCGIFAARQSTIQYLVTSVQHGFTALEEAQTASETDPTEEQDNLSYDLLVLSMGSMINLAEHSLAARHHTITSSTSRTTLESLLTVFDRAQDRIENAESLTESSTNVAFGYLAVMLANLCLDTEVRGFVAIKLPGRHLGLLVESVEEFVRHHERVDALGFEGAEGREVWGAFTEKLRGVLERLRGVAGVVDT
ncbi:hypothetical protein LTR78_003585 [Recurvomyces mirabilis]|uniref:Wings apart-like protein C-terminal domain-containing protein n=1 Tax=Recurvomyces mirabilis TaxID=574656 RepID=A0AAE0WQU2_9PEZI|nr:hypothetical protein LTR78_003585 [Recurvomyces mirabilis]KAK5154700.1 hypothetical protein LTS14_006279 [Recurvomyces mirabilis]